MKVLEGGASKDGKITQSLAKGCGCFSVFFIVFFVWGVWTTYTTYSNNVEVQATVDDYTQTENIDLNSRASLFYTPIVSYKYQGQKYVDTLDYKTNVLQEFEVGSSITISLNPENPHDAIDDSSDTYFFYAIFLVLAVVSYFVYKILKKPQKQTFITTRNSLLKK